MATEELLKKRGPFIVILEKTLGMIYTPNDLLRDNEMVLGLDKPWLEHSLLSLAIEGLEI